MPGRSSTSPERRSGAGRGRRDARAELVESRVGIDPGARGRHRGAAAGAPARGAPQRIRHGPLRGSGRRCPPTRTTPPADTFLSHLVDRLGGRGAARPKRSASASCSCGRVRSSRPGRRRCACRRCPSGSSSAVAFGRVASGRVGSTSTTWSASVSLGARRAGRSTGRSTRPRPTCARRRNSSKALGSALHRPIWFPTPAWLIRLVFGQQATLALGSRRVWPAKALAAGYVFKRPRLEESLDRAFHGPGPA